MPGACQSRAVTEPQRDVASPQGLTEGEKKQAAVKGSLPQSASLTAPSSEGAKTQGAGLSPSVSFADSSLVRGSLWGAARTTSQSA